MKRPIIVFDSGFGGISVLKRLVAAMPNEDYLYYGDSANAPYGTRSKKRVQELSLHAIAEAAKGNNPKAIIIACNTATAAAKEIIQEEYPDIPVIGILPAVRAATQSKKASAVLVLATAGTLASDAYKNILSQIDSAYHIVSLPAPAIVHYVEGGMCAKQILRDNLSDLFEPYKDLHFDSVVLGCTHFPFAADVIADALGYPVEFYDGSALTTTQTIDALREHHTYNDDPTTGSIRIMNSNKQKDCIAFAWKLFSSEIKI